MAQPDQRALAALRKRRLEGSESPAETTLERLNRHRVARGLDPIGADAPVPATDADDPDPDPEGLKLRDPLMQRIHGESSKLRRAPETGLSAEGPDPLADVGLGMDPRDAEAMGFPELAEWQRNLRRTTRVPGEHSPFDQEPGLAKAKDVVNRQWDTISQDRKSLGRARRLLAVEHYDTLRKERDLKYEDMTQEKHQELRDEANEYARRELARLVKRHSNRGNAVMSLASPEEERDQAARGHSLLGWMTGEAALSKVMEAAGEDPADNYWFRAMAPVHALMRPGYTSTDDTESVLGVEKEGKLWWALRLAPSTVVGSYLLDPEIQEAGWGSDEHLEKIQGGYDLFQDQRKIGEAFASLTPWEDPWLLKAGVGFVTVMGVAMMEPDIFTLTLGPAGAALRGAAKAGGGAAGWAAKTLEAPLEHIAKGGDISKLRGRSAEVALRQVQARAAAEESQKIAELLTEAMPGKKTRDAIQVARNRLRAGKRRSADTEQRLREVAKKLREGAKLADEEYAEVIEEVKAFKADDADVIKQDLVRHAAAISRATDRLKQMEALGGAAAETGWTGRLASAKAEYDNLLNKAMEDALRKLVRDVDPEVANKASEIVDKLDDLGRLTTRTKSGKVRQRAAPKKEVINARKRLIYRLERAKLKDRVVRDAIRGMSTGDVEKFRAARDIIMDSFAGMSADVARGRIRAANQMQSALLKAAEDLGIDVSKKVLKTHRQNRLRLGKSLRAAQEKFKAAREWRQTADKVDAVVRGLENQDALRRQAQRTLDEVQLLRKRLMKKVADFQPLKPDQRILAKSRTLDAGTVRAFRAKYADHLDEAIVGEPGGVADMVVRGEVPKGELSGGQLRSLRRLESQMHAAAERARLNKTAGAQTMLDTLAKSKPLSFIDTVTSPKNFLVRFHQIGRWAADRFDPQAADGMGLAAKEYRAIGKRHKEAFTANELELNAHVKRAGMRGVDDYLWTKRPLETHDATSVGNRGSMTLGHKALAYLRHIAKGGDDDVWNGDSVVQALSRMWLPGGRVGDAEAHAVSAALRKLLLTAPDEAWQEPMKIQALMEKMEDVGKAITLKGLEAVDDPNRVKLFYARALLHGAALHDSLLDVARAVGPRFDVETANRGFNFMGDLTNSQVGHLTETTVKQAEEIGRLMGLGRRTGTEMPTGIERGWLGLWPQARKEQIKLVQLAEIEGKGITFPLHVWKGMQAHARNVSKELQAFHDPKSIPGWTVEWLTRSWRLGVVNGWFFPRPAHWMNTYVGDTSQIVTTVGWRAGGRYAAANSVSYIPFVGRKLQDQIGDRLRDVPMVGRAFNPHLSRLMRGDKALLLQTAEGPTNGRILLREAHEDGIWDSISTADLEEAARRGAEGLWNKHGIGKPTKLVENSARMLEAVQHRQRAMFYMEARTGRLTGSKMSREEARKLVMESMYDWRGAPQWELESFARFGAFWMYRRNMIRQLGAALTESITTPAAQYWPKALRGATKASRMRQQAFALSGIPEAIYWQDPEATLDEQAQMDLWGVRQAPWWAEAESILMGRRLSGERQAWYSETLGRQVEYESLVMPLVTTLDQLYLLNLAVQTTAATLVYGAEAAGMETRMTAQSAEQTASDLIDGFSSNLNPFAQNIIDPAIRSVTGIEGPPTSRSGIPVDSGTALILKRLGWERFLATHPDEDGRLRFDRGAAGAIMAATSHLPLFRDPGRAWSIFDNPAMQEDFGSGVAEALFRLTGAVKFGAHDPIMSREYDRRNVERAAEDLVKREADLSAGPM